MAELRDIGPVCLVTGGAGFTGRALVERLLKEGFVVRVLDLHGHRELSPQAELVLGDIRNRETVLRAAEGVGTVFHLAADMYFSRVATAKRRQQIFDINLTGTENVIAACSVRQIKRLVYTSSSSVI